MFQSVSFPCFNFYSFYIFQCNKYVLFNTDYKKWRKYFLLLEPFTCFMKSALLRTKGSFSLPIMFYMHLPYYNCWPFCTQGMTRETQHRFCLWEIFSYSLVISIILYHWGLHWKRLQKVGWLILSINLTGPWGIQVFGKTWWCFCEGNFRYN